MFQIVNGYPCSSACDAAVARRGVDPRNPQNDPVKQERLDAADPSKALQKELKDRVAATRDSQAGNGDFLSASLPPGVGETIDIVA